MDVKPFKQTPQRRGVFVFLAPGVKKFGVPHSLGKIAGREC